MMTETTSAPPPEADSKKKGDHVGKKKAMEQAQQEAANARASDRGYQ
jgi:hypothetical protein